MERVREREAKKEESRGKREIDMSSGRLVPYYLLSPTVDTITRTATANDPYARFVWLLL
jgi:hypothetical protein